MAQVTIDGKFKAEFLSAREIVAQYLAQCELCRNDGNHLVKHIWNKYAFLNAETIRRTRQKIQNELGLFPAKIETQLARQAKEKFMRDNIKKL